MLKIRFFTLFAVLLSAQAQAGGLADSGRLEGVLDGIYYQNNQYYLQGWACQRQVSKPIAVDVYVGNTKLKSAMANVPAENAVAARCGTQDNAHRFSIPLSYSEIAQYAGQTVQVRASGGKSLPGRETQVPNQLNFSYIASNTKGSDITIPKGITAVIDSNIDKGNLTVEGKLACPNTGNFEVKVENIMVHGAKSELVCGTEAQPFQGNISFIFKGNRPVSESNKPGKEFMAMHGGTIRLIGLGGKSGYAKLGKTANIGHNSITLDRAVAWQVGDTIVIAPSSFDYLEAESATITAISHDRRTITLNKSLQYRHWGVTETFHNGKTGTDARRWTLDERAEVANLTRNIKVMSEEDANTRNYIGAHMMIMESAFGYINNVEFTRVGQMGMMGRYPFHWHIAGNVKGQFIKNSSIHNSYQRCITVHETHYALVENNTCYNHFGHGYFLEDGNERKNIIRGNLGLVSKRVPEGRQLLHSDTVVHDVARMPPPATFWISHPDNQITNNVAAGSQGTGFWFAFHTTLDCDSQVACAGFSSKLPASLTDTLQVSDNVVHSSVVGITHDGGPVGALTNNPRNPNDRMVGGVYYMPKTPPILSNFTIYKNQETGQYFRGSQAIFKNFVYADNHASAWWAFNQELHDSLIVGISQNHQNSEFAKLGQTTGVIQYDGPFKLNNVHFANFSAQAIWIDGKDYTPVPFGVVGAAGRFLNKVEKLSFNPVPLLRHNYLANTYMSNNAMILDNDGSLAGVAGAVVQADSKFNRDNSCVNSSYESGVIACQHKLGVVTLVRIPISEPAQYTAQYSLSRSDGANAPIPTRDHQFSVILGKDYSYHISNYDWQPMVDRFMQLTFNTFEANSAPTIVSVDNLPSSCVVSKIGGSQLPSVDSLNTLKNSTSDGYYRAGNTLHIKLLAQQAHGVLSRPENSGLPKTGAEMGRRWWGGYIIGCH